MFLLLLNLINEEHRKKAMISKKSNLTVQAYILLR